jgi:hypothetical protein
MNEKMKALNNARMEILRKIDEAFTLIGALEKEFENDRMAFGMEYAISTHFEDAVANKIARQHWDEIRQYWHQCSGSMAVTGQESADNDLVKMGDFLKDKMFEIEEDAKCRAFGAVKLSGAQKLREEISITALLNMVGDHGPLNIADLYNYTRNTIYYSA